MKKISQEELSRRLTVLSSIARAKVIWTIAFLRPNNYDVPPELIYEAVEFYEKNNNPKRAAKIKDGIGRRLYSEEDILTSFERARLYEEAAKLSEKKGELERAIKNWEQNVDKLKHSTKYWWMARDSKEKAGDLCLKIGEVQKAIKLYFGSRNPDKAIGLAIQSSNEDVLIDLYIEQNRLKDAAEFAEKCGNKRAVQIYLELGEAKKAAEAAEKVGDGELALQIYARHQFYNEVEERTVNDSQRSLLFEKVALTDTYSDHLFSSAAHYAQKAGDLERAIHLLECCGDFAEAAELSKKIGNETKAQGYQEIIDIEEVIFSKSFV